MPKPIVGLHHVTAIASDPQRNLDFYTELLGLRFVKRTINFDDPGTYHFYFGDDVGSPGTILTFFPWPHATRGSLGVGETSATAFSVPHPSLEFWENRLLSAGVPVEHTGERFEEEVLSFADPDGMRLEIVGHKDAGEGKAPRTSDVPAKHVIRGFFGVTLCEGGYERTVAVLTTMGFEKKAEEGNRFRFSAPGSALGNHIDILVQPQLTYGRMGAGSVHHIAFRAPDDAAQLEWRELLAETGLDVTPVLDRTYFHSIYFREPGGVLFEIATDPPGFTLDEPIASLGEALKLPPWLERSRARIERLLPPIQLNHKSRQEETRQEGGAVSDPHRDQPVRTAGAALSEATVAVVMLHGRGASAEDILGLAKQMSNERVAYLAPQAAEHRWYPYSFMAPLDENEPWLSSALAKVASTVQLALDAGIPRDHIVLCGFSQGACMSTEFVARNPARYGALIALTGGLIGPPNMDLRHPGSLEGTPALFSSGDPDPHVPWSRVEESAEQFEAMGAVVTTKRYEGRPHTVNMEEVKAARELIFRLL
jgi:glyoxalase family protein